MDGNDGRLEMLKGFYGEISEDDRLDSSMHGRLEFLTTMEYINEDLERFAEYHFANCEKRELLGASSHLLHICRKRPEI